MTDAQRTKLTGPVERGVGRQYLEHIYRQKPVKRKPPTQAHKSTDQSFQTRQAFPRTRITPSVRIPSSAPRRAAARLTVRCPRENALPTRAIAGENQCERLRPGVLRDRLGRPDL